MFVCVCVVHRQALLLFLRECVCVCVYMWCLQTGPLAVPERVCVRVSVCGAQTGPLAVPESPSTFLPQHLCCSLPRDLNLPDPHLVHAVTLSGSPFPSSEVISPTPTKVFPLPPITLSVVFLIVLLSHLLIVLSRWLPE